ncbi:DUF6223 family protein [Nocardia carnea]|uniref:DUF6223 family protein n=1 Tax=Nocardia carnea TaxID=37328 RepID=UPI0024573A11|nr:DUF6223 family protein [Nocardia carnea]
MSVRHLLTTVAATSSAALVLALPAAAHASAEPAVTGMTSGRVGPSLTALLGLIGVISGARALTSSGRRSGAGPTAAVVAVVTGLISVVAGGLFAATADGGPGTGNGIVAAVIAVMLGLAGTILGALALARSRRHTG